MSEEEHHKMDILWDLAIYNARKAFEKTFSDEDYDSAFWTINIISHKLSHTLDSFLETKTWNEYGQYTGSIENEIKRKNQGGQA